MTLFLIFLIGFHVFFGSRNNQLIEAKSNIEEEINASQEVGSTEVPIEIDGNEVSTANNFSKEMKASTRGINAERAEDIAFDERPSLIRSIQAQLDDIKNAGGQLGYLAGDSLRIPIKLTRSFARRNHPTQGAYQFEGVIEIEAPTFEIVGDDTVEINFIPGRSEIELVRVKNVQHDPVLSIQLVNSTLAYNFRVWEKAAFFWLQVADEKDVIPAGRPGHIHPVQLTYKHMLLAPKLSANATTEAELLLLNEPFVGNPASYYEIVTSAGEVTSVFTKLPDVHTLGDATGEILLTDQYGQQQSITVPFKVHDPLLADPVSQNIALGTKQEDIDVKKWVKDVRYYVRGSIDEAAYTVTLLENVDLSTIGSKEATVRVEILETNENIELTIPIEVEWQDSIRLNTLSGGTIMGLSLIKEGNQFFLKASKGQNDVPSNEGLSHDLSLAILKGLGKNNWTTKYSFDATVASGVKVNDVFKGFETTAMDIGDVLFLNPNNLKQSSETVQQYHSNDEQVLSFDFHEKSQENQIGLFFELTRNGFVQVPLMQLKVEGKQIELYTSESEIAKDLPKLIEYPYDRNIIIYRLEEYPNTSSSGIKDAELLYEYTLESGKTMAAIVPLTFEVMPGRIMLKAGGNMSFEDYQLSSEDSVVGRRQKKWAIEVSDTREQGIRGKWRLMGQLKEAKNELGKYVKFVSQQGGEQDLHFPTLILNHDASTEEGKVVTKTEWSDDNGVLLLVPKDETLTPEKTYESTIEWTLVIGDE